MPPRKRVSAVSAREVPKANTAHPCALQLATALAPSALPARPHSPSYHCFFTSPFYPSSDLPSPAKKRKRAQLRLPPALPGAFDADVVQRKVLQWFDEVRDTRGMPWRKDVDQAQLSTDERTQRGYEVWVSEIMLQQTRVDTVIPYWLRWMEKFPTVQALAQADIEAVNGVWQGLGYYSRAKRLLDGARTVMSDYDGVLPSTAEGLLTIDGIGPYSAGAISSIAFGQRSAMVDGNVIRVLSRLTALHAPDKAKSTTDFIWALADVLVPPQPKERKKAGAQQKDQDEVEDAGGANKPGAWNQGLMELGATVCTPKAPKCNECPLSEECLAYAEARYVAHRPSAAASIPIPCVDVEDLCTLCAPLPYGSASECRAHSAEVYPMAKEKAKKRDEDTIVCLVEWVPNENGENDEGRKVLLVKRPDKGLLAGLNEFPAIDLPPDSSAPSSKARAQMLDSLAAILLDIPPCTFSSDSADVRVLSRATLPAVTQIYSHLNRKYFAERVVLCSPMPPTLRPAASAEKRVRALATMTADDKDETDLSALVQSVPGRAKWVDASDVRTANIGGAMVKVWEERQNMADPARCGGKIQARDSTIGKRKDIGKAVSKVEKGQGSLMGFFKRKDPFARPTTVGIAEPRPKTITPEPSDDEVIVVEKKAPANGVLDAVVARTKSPYKKRRIAPESEDEDT